jgi:hypothetical protein
MAAFGSMTTELMLFSLNFTKIATKVTFLELRGISTLLKLTLATAKTTLKVAGAVVSFVGVAFDVVDVVRGWTNEHSTVPVIRELIDALNSQNVKIEQFLRVYEAAEGYDSNFDL